MLVTAHTHQQDVQCIADHVVQQAHKVVDPPLLAAPRSVHSIAELSLVCHVGSAHHCNVGESRGRGSSRSWKQGQSEVAAARQVVGGQQREQSREQVLVASTTGTGGVEATV